ncbi:MAG: CvpA family protein [Alphaproteobacteria bacterium]|nr:CvpA family protein [Alphaproteobacteria bacterium]
MSPTFTFVDLLTILILLVSIGFAVWRGFISETLAIVAWVAAALATLYFGPLAIPLFARMISLKWLAVVAAYSGVFLVVLLPISFASYRISESVRESAVGPLDRFFGAGFGLVRGLVIAGGLYLVFSMIVPVRDHPAALRNAEMLPVIQGSAEALIALAPRHDREAAQDSMNAEPTPQPVPAKQPVGMAPGAADQRAHRHAVRRYGADDRQALDKLIESSGAGRNKP